jgi:uridine kinase
MATSDAVPRSQPQLIVLRGNSGAGKSTVACGLRAELGRGVAIVDQDADLLEGIDERIVPEHSSASDTVQRILTENFPHHSTPASMRSVRAGTPPEVGV